ncbi:MAG: DUF456 family protein [Cyanobacteria bacterium P01_F01_bin.150]
MMGEFGSYDRLLTLLTGSTMHLLPLFLHSLIFSLHVPIIHLQSFAEVALTASDLSLSQWLYSHLVEFFQGISQGISQSLLTLVQGDLLHSLWSGFIHRLDELWITGQASLHHFGKGIADFTGTVTGFVASTALWQLGLYWLLLVLMFAGVVGSFVPALPGITLVLLAIVIWGIAVGFSGIVLSLVVAIAAFVLCLAIDNLAGILSAQKVGASRWGQIGAIIGMFMGFFGFLPALPVGGPLLGIIFGTVLGAFIGEFLHRHNLALGERVKQAAKVGIAIVVGNLVGNLLQGIVALITLIVFVFNTWGMVYG